jgi:Spy/CpxP family protein refolding chaperone
MKKNFLRMFYLILGFFLITSINFKAAAQQCQQGAGCKPGYYNLPGITEDQTKKMDDVRMKHMKQVIPIKSMLKEKKARINTLMVAEKPDMAAINAAVDEMTNLDAQLLKLKVQCKQDIRALLTDNQKVLFDSKQDIFEGGCCGQKDMKKECAHEGQMKPCPMQKGMGPGPGPGNPNCPQHEKK